MKVTFEITDSVNSSRSSLLSLSVFLNPSPERWTVQWGSLLWSWVWNSTGILGHLTSEDLAISTAEPGRQPYTVVRGALMFLWRCCSMDKWRNPGIHSGIGRPPAVENGQCVAVLPLYTGFWWSHVDSSGVDVDCLWTSDGHEHYSASA